MYDWLTNVGEPTPQLAGGSHFQLSLTTHHVIIVRVIGIVLQKIKDIKHQSTNRVVWKTLLVHVLNTRMFTHFCKVTIIRLGCHYEPLKSLILMLITNNFEILK